MTHVWYENQYVRADWSHHSQIADSQSWNYYDWWDGAQKGWEDVDTVKETTNDPLISSDYNYDASGHLTSVRIDDGAPHTVSYVTDVLGQVLERKDSAQANKRDVHFYFNGEKIGDVSWNGTAISSADFGQAYEHVSKQGAAPLAQKYTVREGDSFAGIAAMMWGDASLWWMIADANGMSSDSELAAGMTITIPNKVHNVHNNAETFRPYDPNAAIGPVSPTKPKPLPPGSNDGGCGLAQIFVAIIAIVVVAIVMPHAIAAVANVIGGAGTATVTAGAFGFSGVTFAGAGGAAVAAGATAASVGTIAVSSFVGGAFAGAVGSIVSQGAAIANGPGQVQLEQIGVSALATGFAAGALDGAASPQTGISPASAAMSPTRARRMALFLGACAAKHSLSRRGMSKLSRGNRSWHGRTPESFEIWPSIS